jgi:acyl-CoA-binding protein
MTSIFLLTQEFKAAAEKVRNLDKTPSNDEFAEMYSLFKQASCGDCDKGKYLYI